MAENTWSNRHVWIIGAGSGIGQSLAVELSRQGAHLVLSGRNSAALADTALIINKPSTRICVLDARAVSSLSELWQDLHSQNEITCVIYMAGLYEPKAIDQLEPDLIHDIITTNLSAAINLSSVVLPSFKAKKSGLIALCGSIAGYRGLPNAQPYAASKAGLINFAESLRLESAPYGVDVKIINPGFVKTRLTDKNSFSMPMRIEPDEAARIIASGLLSSKFEIAFPTLFAFAAKIMRVLPFFLYEKLAPK